MTWWLVALNDYDSSFSISANSCLMPDKGLATENNSAWPTDARAAISGAAAATGSLFPAFKAFLAPSMVNFFS